ncbi:hypothetical protein SynRS9907_00850 [Synechococcus sp. RS9907]|nr:hypothetical protein SynRS9907_00850 [Synechococcus sp. RS9907]
MNPCYFTGGGEFLKDLNCAVWYICVHLSVAYGIGFLRNAIGF